MYEASISLQAWRARTSHILTVSGIENSYRVGNVSVASWGIELPKGQLGLTAQPPGHLLIDYHCSPVGLFERFSHIRYVYYSNVLIQDSKDICDRQGIMLCLLSENVWNTNTCML